MAFCLELDGSEESNERLYAAIAFNETGNLSVKKAIIALQACLPENAWCTLSGVLDRDGVIKTHSEDPVFNVKFTIRSKRIRCACCKRPIHGEPEYVAYNGPVCKGCWDMRFNGNADLEEEIDEAERMLEAMQAEEEQGAGGK